MSHQRVGYTLSTFQRLSQGGILWKESLRGTPRMFFPFCTGVALSMCVPTTSFKLMVLQNIMVEEALLSKSTSVTIKQHPTQFNLKIVKRRKLKSVIMHCESLTSQIGFYSVQIRMLNTLCFHCYISEIPICKDFPLKFFLKKHFHDNLVK